MRAALICAVAWSLYAGIPKMDARVARADSRTSAMVAPTSEAVEVLELEIDPRASRWNGRWTTSIPVRPGARPPDFVLAGPTLDSVQLLDGAGRPVEILWGTRGDGRTQIEPRTPLPPEPHTLQVAYSGDWAAADSGLVRAADTSHVAWRHAVGHVVPVLVPPARPRGVRLVVHVPVRWRVRSRLAVVRTERQRGWTTTVFGLRAGTGPDALEFEVVPNRRR